MLMFMHTYYLKAGLLCGAALLMTGCIVVDRSDTVYLGGDGSLQWLVIEKDVRSTCEKREDRDREEREWVQRVVDGEHTMPASLTRLGGYDIRCSLVRDQRPYMVVSQASFSNLETLGWEIVRSTGLQGSSGLTRLDERRMRFTLTLRKPPGDEEVKGDEVAMNAAAGWVSGMKIVLDEGELLEATGFVIDECDTTVATVPDDFLKGISLEDPQFELSLTWQTPAPR